MLKKDDGGQLNDLSRHGRNDFAIAIHFSHAGGLRDGCTWINDVIAQLGVEPWTKGWHREVMRGIEVHFECPERLQQEDADMGRLSSDAELDLGIPTVLDMQSVDSMQIDASQLDASWNEPEVSTTVNSGCQALLHQRDPFLNLLYQLFLLFLFVFARRVHHPRQQEREGP